MRLDPLPDSTFPKIVHSQKRLRICAQAKLRIINLFRGLTSSGKHHAEMKEERAHELLRIFAAVRNDPELVAEATLALDNLGEAVEQVAATPPGLVYVASASAQKSAVRVLSSRAAGQVAPGLVRG